MPNIQLSDVPEPITPSHETTLYKNGLIVTVIPNALKEDSPSQERDLQSLDIYVYTIFVPRPCSKAVGYEGCEEAIEVEQEEEGPAASSAIFMYCKSKL
jgi:hypothetical protein